MLGITTVDEPLEIARHALGERAELALQLRQHEQQAAERPRRRPRASSTKIAMLRRTRRASKRSISGIEQVRDHERGGERRQRRLQHEEQREDDGGDDGADDRAPRGARDEVAIALATRLRVGSARVRLPPMRPRLPLCDAPRAVHPILFRIGSLRSPELRRRR